MLKVRGVVVEGDEEMGRTYLEVSEGSKAQGEGTVLEGMLA